MIDIASAQTSVPGKGEDSLVVRRLSGDAGRLLIAVADGISMQNGKAASLWVAEFLRSMPEPSGIRDIHTRLSEALATRDQPRELSGTTLTCGILSEVDAVGTSALRLDFFAIGDSPIWRIVQSRSEKYRYQRYTVHGSPYPAEGRRVYAALWLDGREISGDVFFGAAEFGPNEVLVLCTDGVPEREVMVRDLEVLDRPTLCAHLFQADAYASPRLQEVLESYGQAGLLYDDASMVVARMPQREVLSHPEANIPDSEVPHQERVEGAGPAEPATDVTGLEAQAVVESIKKTPRKPRGGGSATRAAVGTKPKAAKKPPATKRPAQVAGRKKKS